MKVVLIVALGAALALVMVNPSPVTILGVCAVVWGLTLPSE